jgi:cbb3-type cytochrome oxidase subunit 3
MSVIPLTLVISLCLVFTFVVFFALEQSRNRFHSAESQAILPLADETPRLVPARATARRDRHDCGCARGDASACAHCRQSQAS